MSRQRPRRWRERSPYPGDWLYLMATADGWCMVRHTRAVPFTIPLKEWEAMPLVSPR